MRKMRNTSLGTESDANPKNNLKLYLDEIKPKTDISIERAIIECLLSDSCCISETDILLPEMFVDKMNREIYISIKEIVDASSPVNVSTISANFKLRNIDIQEKKLTEYLETLDPVVTENITFYVQILRYLYLQKQFYDLMSLAPLALGENARLDNFYKEIKTALIPLNRTLFDTHDRPFKPHWITNGTTTYKVLKSKFDSGGYVWIDNVAVNEVELLASGFEIVFHEPGAE